jgi:branched-chain amino acid transport system ATP-binding protein
MLELKNIEVMYQNVIYVLKGVSLSVGEGEIVTLLGANGAGKTTTLKAISGLLKTEQGDVTRGRIEFMGKKIDHMSPEDIVKLGIVQVMEGQRLFKYLTVDENLRLGAYVRGNGGEVAKDLDMVFNYFPKLRELRNQTSGYLSGGERQMLVVGRALMAHPKFMLLDEPSLGLAPFLVKEIFEILKRINEEEGTSILVVEQNAFAALSLAQRGYVMEDGKIVLDGPAQELRENEDIKEFYFGLSSIGQRKSYKGVKHYRRRKRWLA